MSQTHRLEVVPSKQYPGETEIVQTGRDTNSILDRYGFGFVAPGESARQVQGGPLVPGPWAYAYRLCTVLDGTKPKADDVNFQIGDRFEIGGFVFDSKPAPNNNMDLVLAQ